jgi:inner membrane protein
MVAEEAALPTVFTHALAGAAIAQVFAPCGRIGRATLLAAGAAALPDADALGLPLGVDYGSALGHRGFTHSLLFAGIVAAGAAAGRDSWNAAERWRLAACLFAAAATHGALDALTDGGLGVAFFAPFSEKRYFFPARPIRVAPLSAGALFSRWGASALSSEARWVLLPAAAMALAAKFLRKS